MDAESKYHNHFSQSLQVFSEIYGVKMTFLRFGQANPGAFETPIYEKIIF